MIIIGLWILAGVLPCFSQESSERKVNFPKKEEFVKDMPSKKNLWVFLMAGQSNMAGRGFVEPEDTLADPRIMSIDRNERWVLAKEPLHFYEPAMNGLDCGLSFAHELIRHLNDSVDIALIPCAIGGSSIEQWLGDSLFRGVNLLSNFREKVNLAKQYGVIKGILWHQGESDAHPPFISHYEDNLRILIGKFREIAGDGSLPVFIGELGRYAEPASRGARWDSINVQKREYVSSDKNSYLISSAGLTERGDNTHFNSSSQRELGKRFADQFLETLAPATGKVSFR